MEGAEERRGLADRRKDMEAEKEKWLLLCVCVCVRVNLFVCYLGDLKGAGRSCRSPAVTVIVKTTLSLDD